MYYEKEQEMINYGEITKFKESTIEKYHSIVYFAILFTVFCVTYHTLSEMCIRDSVTETWRKHMWKKTISSR